MNTEEIRAILAPLIKSELLEQAYAAGVTDKAIFTQQLYIAMMQWSPGILIKHPWQLHALGSKLREIHDFKDWSLKDNLGISPAHYIAWSGNLDNLKWAVTQDKDALTRESNDGDTVAHFSAWSGNKDSLEWVLTQDKDALTKNDIHGRTVAYFSAWSGNKDSLEWVLTQDKDALTRKNNYGRTVAHCAARSGSKILLEWLLTQDKDALTRKDYNGVTVAHFAAWSRNPRQLNKVLQLSNAYSFDGKSLEGANADYLSEIFTTVEKALATNYVVTEVSYPSDVKEETRKGINNLLERNKLLMEGLNDIQQPVASGTLFAKRAPGQTALYEKAVNLKQRAYSLESDKEKQEVFEEILELSQTYWSKKLGLDLYQLDTPAEILRKYLEQPREETNTSPKSQKSSSGAILAEVEYAQSEGNWEAIVKIIENKNAALSAIPESILEYFKYRAILAIPGNPPSYVLPGPQGSVNS